MNVDVEVTREVTPEEATPLIIYGRCECPACKARRKFQDRLAIFSGIWSVVCLIFFAVLFLCFVLR